MSASKPTARIGISGWRYKPWRGTFYPHGLIQRDELAYAAGRLDTIELNGSFYSLQRPSSYLQWRDATPSDFVFSIKGGRFITHMLRLRGVRIPLANFFASGVLALGPKLGPVLWQLPERVHFNAEELDQFLTLLPHSTAAAAELAADHDERMTDRSFTTVSEDRPLRHALEIRHPSYLTTEFYELLRRHNTALVVADSAGRWPMVTEVTADFVYVRLHGSEELYVSGYSDEHLDVWAATVRGWLSGAGCPDGRGRDVLLYFDNDVKVHAPFNAMALAQRLRTVEGEAAR